MIPIYNFLTKKPYSEIDEKVKNLVDAMNGTGVITTIASCQGHGIFGKPPYVYFKAPVEIAASIEKLLREIAVLDDVRFQEAWVIEGRFDEAFNLAFVLYSPAYHKKTYSLWALINFGLLRKRLDSELLALADVVEQAVLSNVRDQHKPHISTSCYVPS